MAGAARQKHRFDHVLAVALVLPPKVAESGAEVAFGVVRGDVLTVNTATGTADVPPGCVSDIRTR